MGGAGAHIQGNASSLAPPCWAGVGGSPLCACAEPGRFGSGLDQWLSLGGSVGGPGAAGAPQTALPPAVNSIITGHGVGAPLK